MGLRTYQTWSLLIACAIAANMGAETAIINHSGTTITAHQSYRTKSGPRQRGGRRPDCSTRDKRLKPRDSYIFETARSSLDPLCAPSRTWIEVGDRTIWSSSDAEVDEVEVRPTTIRYHSDKTFGGSASWSHNTKRSR